MFGQGLGHLTGVIFILFNNVRHRALLMNSREPILVTLSGEFL